MHDRLRKSVLGTLFAAFFLLLGLIATPSATAAPASPNAFLHFVNWNSGQCLAVPNGSTAQGAGLIQWPCGSFHDHYWELQPQSNGYYTS